MNQLEIVKNECISCAQGVLDAMKEHVSVTRIPRHPIPRARHEAVPLGALSLYPRLQGMQAGGLRRPVGHARGQPPRRRVGDEPARAGAVVLGLRGCIVSSMHRIEDASIHRDASRCRMHRHRTSDASRMHRMEKSILDQNSIFWDIFLDRICKKIPASMVQDAYHVLCRRNLTFQASKLRAYF